MVPVLIWFFNNLINVIEIICKSKNELIVENLTRRQQFLTYETKKPKPKNYRFGCFLLDSLTTAWLKWEDYLIIIKSEIVIEWCY
jgi:hypothetical protein